MSLDLRFDEDLMPQSSFKAIVSNSVSLTVPGPGAGLSCQLGGKHGAGVLCWGALITALQPTSRLSLGSNQLLTRVFVLGPDKRKRT